MIRSYMRLFILLFMASGVSAQIGVEAYFFGTHEVEGLVLYQVEGKRKKAIGNVDLDVRMCPGSSFALFHALMAIEDRVVEGLDEEVAWDGKSLGDYDKSAGPEKKVLSLRSAYPQGNSSVSYTHLTLPTTSRV